MREHPSSHQAQESWASPVPFQAESATNAMPAPGKLLPFLRGLGQALLLVPLVVALAILVFELARYIRGALVSLFALVPGIFLYGLIVAIRLTRRPAERWVGIGFFVGLFIYAVCAALLLNTLYVLLTEL